MYIYIYICIYIYIIYIYIYIYIYTVLLHVTKEIINNKPWGQNICLWCKYSPLNA